MSAIDREPRSRCHAVAHVFTLLWLISRRDMKRIGRVLSVPPRDGVGVSAARRPGSGSRGLWSAGCDAPIAPADPGSQVSVQLDQEIIDVAVSPRKTAGPPLGLVASSWVALPPVWVGDPLAAGDVWWARCEVPSAEYWAGLQVETNWVASGRCLGVLE